MKEQFAKEDDNFEVPAEPQDTVNWELEGKQFSVVPESYHVKNLNPEASENVSVQD